MNDAFFFGYGSLVNRATHDHAAASPARIEGWRRAWRRTPLRDLCYLTAVRCETSAIDGLVAQVAGADFTQLDQREAAYDRIEAAHQVAPSRASVVIYAIAPDASLPADDDHPILLSYLDVVLQGYLREYGPEGAERFVTSTDGWQAPVLDDRANPRYARAQTLSAQERGFVDNVLRDVGSRLI